MLIKKTKQKKQVTVRDEFKCYLCYLVWNSFKASPHKEWLSPIIVPVFCQSKLQTTPCVALRRGSVVITPLCVKMWTYWSIWSSGKVHSKRQNLKYLALSQRRSNTDTSLISMFKKRSSFIIIEIIALPPGHGKTHNTDLQYHIRIIKSRERIIRF